MTEAKGSAGAGAETEAETPGAQQPKQHFGLMMAVYLVGLAIGGLYVGMVSPARTVVQLGFGIDDATGIWMINIYTLFYAALIPVIGKLADLKGRKRVFTACVGVFAVGAVLCGLSQSAGSFALLLVGRVVQAVGAGGMIPVANAEMGTSFPPDKRGMALGMAAAVVGLANVLGAAVGSLILGLAGSNWGIMFYVCVPFCVLVIAGALAFLPNNVYESKEPLDIAGSCLFVLFVLMLLLGVKAIDFTDASSVASPSVWAPLVVAVASAVAFRRVELSAQSPVFHMEYLHSRPIVITMAVSFFIGCVIIAMVLVPQFAEFAMGVPAGSGGYYLMAIGIMAIFGPPLSGKLIDKLGPKPVLMGGLGVMVAGYLALALVVAPHPSTAALVVGLAVVGLGMGFAMGAPTNYMVLENTDAADSNSAIATITLVRQIGTTLAPAILVGFTGQGTLAGYQQMLLCVATFSAIAFALMLFYHSPQKGAEG